MSQPPALVGFNPGREAEPTSQQSTEEENPAPSVLNKLQKWVGAAAATAHPLVAPPALKCFAGHMLLMSCLFAAAKRPAAAHAGKGIAPPVCSPVRSLPARPGCHPLQADYPAMGSPVRPTRFIPCKTPMSNEILDNWSLADAPQHALTVPVLLQTQAAAGRRVGLIIDLANHDCL